MKKFVNKNVLIPALLFVLINISCSAYETFVNITRLKFRLSNVSSFTISGVNLSSKSKLKDFSASEILKISSSFAAGNLPSSFVINVEAKNPNDGKGGYARTNATLQSFPWRLLIDDKETVSGNIGSSVFVPGTGETTNLPLLVNLDLMRFFKDKGYESLLNLALNIGGQGGTSSRLTLYAQPTVSTTLGNITYPQEIKIVNYEFSS
jgi:hypothetical protein